jgi:hypothetical protein
MRTNEHKNRQQRQIESMDCKRREESKPLADENSAQTSSLLDAQTQKSARAAYIDDRRQTSGYQEFPRNFLRQVLLKLDCNTVQECASILRHRYAMAIACTDNTLRDFTVKKRGTEVVWKTGLPSSDGRTYLVIRMPISVNQQGTFTAEWRPGRPKAIARIKPSAIPEVFCDNVVVPGHALQQSLKRSGKFVERDGVVSLINNAIKQGISLTRVYYENKKGIGAIQWLISGQRPGIVYAIHADYEHGHVYSATSLDEQMANTLRKTADPPTHRRTSRTHRGVKA